jgi:hypothetical protein
MCATPAGRQERTDLSTELAAGSRHVAVLATRQAWLVQACENIARPATGSSARSTLPVEESVMNSDLRPAPP